MAYHIEQKETRGKGMFFIEENGDIVAELHYALRPDGILTLDHTEVHPRMAGQGLGSQLVKHSVEFARSNGYKVKPLCTYAAKQFERHPEYKELQLNQS